MLELKDIRIQFENNIVFDDLSHCFDTSSITCIKTGVLDGGTSLLKCCAGIIKPALGSVSLDGRSIENINDQDIFNDINFCYESGGLVSIFTVYNNIALPMVYHGKYTEKEIRQRIKDIAKKLGIADLLQVEPHQLNDVHTRLANLTRALVISPKLLLVDELQAGMSPEMREAVLEVLTDYQKRDEFTLIMTTTAGDENSFADYRYKIFEQHLVETT